MADTFYRETKPPTGQPTYFPGDDYTEDEDQGMPPGNPGFRNLPERDQMDPSSAKVIPDSMKQQLRQNYGPKAARVAAGFLAQRGEIFKLEPEGPAKRIVEGLERLDSWVRGEAPFPKTAATIDEILGNTGPKVKQRAGKVKLTPKRFSPDKGFWTFTAQSSSGESYTIRIKGIRKGNIVNLSKAPVKCSCSCPYWRWQGPEHWANKHGFLYKSRRVRPRGTMSTPVIRDPQGKHWVCKHVAAALRKARSYRFAAAEGWSFDGEPVLEPSPEWVAAHWAQIRG